MFNIEAWWFMGGLLGPHLLMIKKFCYFLGANYMKQKNVLPPKGLPRNNFFLVTQMSSNLFIYVWDHKALKSNQVSATNIVHKGFIMDFSQRRETVIITIIIMIITIIATIIFLLLNNGLGWESKITIQSNQGFDKIQQNESSLRLLKTISHCVS